MSFVDKLRENGAAVGFNPELEYSRRSFTSAEKLPYQQYEFRTKDGVRLVGWFTKPPSKSGMGGVGTVIHAHPSVGNITHYNKDLAFLAHGGLNVFTFDYRGFGRSQGKATKETSRLDLEAAIDVIDKRSLADPSRICLFGQEMGAGLSLMVASERKDLRGIAIEAPFQRFRQMDKIAIGRAKGLSKISKGFWYMFSPSTLEPIDAAEKVRCPVLLIHSLLDRVVPFSDGKEIYRKLKTRKQLMRLEGVTHLSYEEREVRLEYEERLVSFFRECFVGKI